MNLTQIFLIVIISFIIVKTYKTYIHERLAPAFIVLWIALWTSILFFVIESRMLIYIANKFGIGRGVDLALYVSVLLLLYICYKILVRVEKMNRDLTKIVREIALSKLKKNS